MPPSAVCSSGRSGGQHGEVVVVPEALAEPGDVGSVDVDRGEFSPPSAPTAPSPRLALPRLEAHARTAAENACLGSVSGTW
jgi:hypothetical protein